jgi:hypothetical protein
VRKDLDEMFARASAALAEQVEGVEVAPPGAGAFRVRPLAEADRGEKVAPDPLYTFAPAAAVGLLLGLVLMSLAGSPGAPARPQPGEAVVTFRPGSAAEYDPIPESTAARNARPEVVVPTPAPAPPNDSDEFLADSDYRGADDVFSDPFVNTMLPPASDPSFQYYTPNAGSVPASEPVPPRAVFNAEFRNDELVPRPLLRPSVVHPHPGESPQSHH